MWTSELIDALMCAGENIKRGEFEWKDAAKMLNEKYHVDYRPETYRQRYSNLKNIGKLHDLVPNESSSTSNDTKTEVNNLYQEVRKEIVHLRDERTQLNAYVRRINREETIKEIARETADTINDKILLDSGKEILYDPSGNTAILLISDWHYGLETTNYWNKYNPDIARERVSILRDKTLLKLKQIKPKKLIVLNLGDLISGRIHLQLRIQSRYDVIQQTMHVSEMLAEFLSSMPKNLPIDYFDCIDNHSRIEPNKKEALQLESLALFIPWYLKTRLKDKENITIYDNEIAPDIITFNELGFNIGGVHGDLDKPNKVIDNISMMTGINYDLMVSAHLHHFSADEKNECLLISNGSLIGVDDFSAKLRLSAKPSQTLIVVSPDNVTEEIHRIICKEDNQ